MDSKTKVKFIFLIFKLPVEQVFTRRKLTKVLLKCCTLQKIFAGCIVYCWTGHRKQTSLLLHSNSLCHLISSAQSGRKKYSVFLMNVINHVSSWKDGVFIKSRAAELAHEVFLSAVWKLTPNFRFKFYDLQIPASVFCSLSRKCNKKIV